jgi:hypothetical protein
MHVISQQILSHPLRRTSQDDHLAKTSCISEVTRCEGSVFEPPYLSYEAWRERFRSTCGRYNPEGVEPTAFTGAIEMTAMAARASMRR